MLAELKSDGATDEGDQQSSLVKPLIGVGLDSCVIPLRHELSLVQTTDFFYPLVDDPYTMGRIACCNVLSDIYAMGVDNCDNMLMLLGVSNLMTDAEKKVVIPLMIRGFKDCATEAGSSVQGGQTVVNPWLIIGGVATSVCPTVDIVMPQHGQVGDVLVLTKPLGTQVAVNVHQWMDTGHGNYEKIKCVVTDADIDALFEAATRQMARLNRRAARLLRKYAAHGCTDVTGFGVLGHAANLAESQLAAVDLVIECLPCLAHSCDIDDAVNGMFKLRRGLSAETSGGLLVMLDRGAVDGFLSEMAEVEGQCAWVVGSVQSGSRQARLLDNATIIPV